ncbi:MAG: sugar ABC transporter permease [Chloroflexi bacterium]|nr:sugar ABC transporter permease [Chloroflexota bacterium]
MPSRATRRRYGLFVLLVAPAVLLRFGTAVYPIVQTIIYSFRDFSLLRGTDTFIGLENYADLTTNFGVRSALSFTVIYVIASTILELGAGLLIAQLLNSNFKGQTFARTINLIPWAIPTIVAGYAFRWLLDEQFGLIPYWVTQFTGEQMVVFIDPVSARVAVILAHVWKDAPFMAVVFLAGMQGIPLDLYEAAKVDGANAWHRFWRITMPLVAPLVITMGLFRIVWSLASFDLVLGLTAGGPGVATSVLALQIFREGILFFKFGFASAISMLLLVLVALVGAIGLWLYRRFDVSY